MRLPLDAVRSSDVTEQMRRHIERIDGVSYIQVHPTFLYESLWCMVLLIILFAYRKHKKYEGELFFDVSVRIRTGKILDRRITNRPASSSRGRDCRLPASCRCDRSRHGGSNALSAKKSHKNQLRQFMSHVLKNRNSSARAIRKTALRAYCG